MSDRDAMFPSTDRSPACPAVDASFTGLRVAAPAEIAPRGSLPVAGVFQLPAAEAARLGAHRHRALVLVVMTRHADWAIFTPFQDTLLFDDDEERAGAMVRGHFDLRLFEGAKDDLAPGEYYLTASLGEHLSETIRFEVR